MNSNQVFNPNQTEWNWGRINSDWKLGLDQSIWHWLGYRYRNESEKSWLIQDEFQFDIFARVIIDKKYIYINHCLSFLTLFNQSVFLFLYVYQLLQFTLAIESNRKYIRANNCLSSFILSQKLYSFQFASVLIYLIAILIFSLHLMHKKSIHVNYCLSFSILILKTNCPIILIHRFQFAFRSLFINQVLLFKYHLHHPMRISSTKILPQSD